MECANFNSVVSVLLDGSGGEVERRRLVEHARKCPVCSQGLADHRRMRQVMLQMPKKQPSSQLQANLRVLGSKERERVVARLSFAAQFRAWHQHVRWQMKNMMQPFALPIAGGLVSALLLFTILLPDFSIARPIDNDVPTVLFTEASVKDTVPLTLASEVVVDLQVDEQGRMVDYSIVRGGSLLRDETVRRRFESALLFTQFTPATTFGQPTSGRIRVSFRNSTIDVKG